MQQQPDSGTLYICPLSTCVPSFNFLGLTVREKSVMKIFNDWKLERKKNKGTKKSSSMSPVYTTHPPIFHMCNKFQTSRPHSSWEKCDEKFSCLKIGEKEKWKIKGQISSSSLIPVYTIHLSIVHMCTKFQPSRLHSSWEKCDEKFQYFNEK